MATEYLGTGSPDGTSFGRSDDLITFYGGTPVARPSGSAQAALSTDLLTLTGSYNSTILITIFTALINLANANRSALVTVNLMKGSA